MSFSLFLVQIDVNVGSNLEVSKESCHKKIIIQATEAWHQQTRKQKKE